MQGTNALAYVRRSIGAVEKKFYNIVTRAQCNKTFYDHNFQMILISRSVCPLQTFPAKSNVAGKAGAYPSVVLFRHSSQG